MFATIFLYYVIYGKLIGIFVPEYEWYYLYIHPVSRFFEYLISIIVGMIFKLIRKNNCINSCIGTIFEIGIFVLLIYIITSLNKHEYSVATEIIATYMSLALAIVYSMEMGWISKIFSMKIPLGLGNISMECFLIHQILINFYSAMGRNGDDTFKLFSFLYLLGTTIIVSYSIHKLNGYRNALAKQQLYKQVHHTLQVF